MDILPCLLGTLRACCTTFPDKRTGANGRYSMTDIGLSAFSLFFMQSPSFLAHQRQLEQGQGRSNCQTLFGIERIPSDNHIRAMLDPVPPEQLFPALEAALTVLEESGGLLTFQRLGGHMLVALDGTEYFRSARTHCSGCSQRARSGGKAEWFHALLAAALVAPGHDRVVPLPPAFITPRTATPSRTARAWPPGVG